MKWKVTKTWLKNYFKPISPKKEERYYAQSFRNNGKNGSLLGHVCFWGHNEPAPTSAP
jgi:hypothetical protein